MRVPLRVFYEFLYPSRVRGCAFSFVVRLIETQARCPLFLLQAVHVGDIHAPPSPLLLLILITRRWSISCVNVEKIPLLHVLVEGCSIERVFSVRASALLEIILRCLPCGGRGRKARPASLSRRRAVRRGLVEDFIDHVYRDWVQSEAEICPAR